MADIVIGSGPSGVAAASARLALGREVVLIDGGSRLADTDERRRTALSSKPPQDWTEQDVKDWQAPQSKAPSGQVRRYGSDFAMVPASDTFEDKGGVALRASYAAGGLSNLWGSAVLPYAARDMAGWPISADEMAAHYHAAAELFPMSGRKDALQELFPLIEMEGRNELPSSPQGEALLSRFDSRKKALARLGIVAGKARQAVDMGCRLCGQCLHGCPWRLIWSSQQTLERLRANPRFSYRPGQIARSVEEDGEGVTIRLDDGSSLRGDRVFIGAGVLETARLIMASVPSVGEVILKDSQQAFLPTLHRWRSPSRPHQLPTHTLAQAFVEVDDPAISPWLVHAQIYTWNEFYEPDLMASYGRLPMSGPLLAALSRRLIVAQTFLHSDHSARIALRLGPSGKLVGKVNENPDTKPVLARALKRVAEGLKLGGLVPLTFAARPGAAGSSFHVGASFPMGLDRSRHSSDVLGRPLGFSRIHIVDASTLPAIPATTITFGVMAHAHRIGAVSPVD